MLIRLWPRCETVICHWAFITFEGFGIADNNDANNHKDYGGDAGEDCFEPFSEISLEAAVHEGKRAKQ